jgi:RNA-splicing ligase RtcB
MPSAASRRRSSAPVTPFLAAVRGGAVCVQKDVERVVAVVERARLARCVARLRPLGVVKG